MARYGAVIRYAVCVPVWPVSASSVCVSSLEGVAELHRFVVIAPYSRRSGGERCV